MTKLEAIIQPSRFETVKEVLSELGVEGMTISDVRGHGRQKGHTENYRGREYSVDLLPKIKLEVVLADNLVDAVVDAIVQTAGSGKIGDGKIFLYKVEEAIRIRNQERVLSGTGTKIRELMCAGWARAVLCPITFPDRSHK
jgi:nitrogen regulatory protein P-II 1